MGTGPCAQSIVGHHLAAAGRRCTSRMSKVDGPFHFLILYPLLPWLGVMLLGFGAAGAVRARRPRRTIVRCCGGASPSRRCSSCCCASSTAMASPIIGRRRRPRRRHAHRLPERHEVPAEPGVPDDDARARGDLLRVRRIAWRGFLKDTLVMFGRVPFAFYVAHFYLLHALQRAAGRGAGIRRAQLDDLSAVLSAGLRRLAARGVLRVGCAWFCCCIRSAAGWRASRRARAPGG